jgi:hypothetical protein
MDKNYNTNMDCKRMMAEFTEAFGDAAVEMTFREVVKGMDSFFGLMGMTIELVNLIHKEEELKKHHRAYLHVRAEIENRADAVMELIAGIVDELNAKEHFYHVSAEGAFPFAKAEDEGEAVTIPKDKYDLMIEDLLTMAELLGMVADMRTKDVRAIQEFGKYVPAFAAFEKNRLRLYREAAQEAEDILNRWEDEIDEDDEPDEYFSD